MLYCNLGECALNWSSHFLQSSWTKQHVEVDSSQTASPLDQVAECPDSTCAQVIRPNAETSGGKRGYITTEMEGNEEDLPGDECDPVPF